MTKPCGQAGAGPGPARHHDFYYRIHPISYGRSEIHLIWSVRSQPLPAPRSHRALPCYANFVSFFSRVWAAQSETLLSHLFLAWLGTSYPMEPLAADLRSKGLMG